MHNIAPTPSWIWPPRGPRYGAVLRKPLDPGASEPKANLISPDMAIDAHTMSWQDRLRYSNKMGIGMKLLGTYCRRVTKLRKRARKEAASAGS